MLVTLGVSKRHVHLTEESWKILFGDQEMVKRNDLGQPTQFASTSKVNLEFNGKIIDYVRVIGPTRKYNQIELSQSDASVLGINPPRRQSGDLIDSLPIRLIGPCGTIDLTSGVILAEMHIHMDEVLAKRLGIVDKQLMSVFKDNNYLFDAKVKVSTLASLELHIDTDEAEYYNLKTGDILDFRVCGK